MIKYRYSVQFVVLLAIFEKLKYNILNSKLLREGDINGKIYGTLTK